MKKTSKRLLALLCAVLLLLPALHTAQATMETTGTTKEGLEYSIIRRVDGLKFTWWTTITGYIGPDNEVIIPEEIDGKPVTSIGESAFAGCSGLTSITLPAGVTSIGNNAFDGCSGLTSITIPKSVTSIGAFAFTGSPVIIYGSLNSKAHQYATNNGIPFVAQGKTSNGLEYRIDSGKATITKCRSDASVVTVPDKVEGVPVTRIGEKAFSAITLVNGVSLPDSITSIEGSAFSSCYHLQFITIPAGVTSIEKQTFFFCESLSSVTLPAGLTRIGESAFEACYVLPSITIPAGVISIGDSAFDDCIKLTSMTLPASVTSIGEKAFRGCSGLMSITIPKSVTSIGADAFADTPVAIYGYLNSKAHQYATDNNIPFKPLDAPAPLPGDANGDGNVDIVDLVSIIDFIVNGTHCPSMENADANGDKIIDIVDLVWIINKLVGI